ncbi:LysR family transcriptional regulator [Paenibacillus filicis]|uniref:LysR family transcriptional regulator n=1 Tax=Paenibacillus filicis TaxID=669464 RepID=A0ABU9DH08_9BACL
MIVETLRVFVAVAEQSHFSRAAELLNLSQPGVSQHIRNLENEWGTKLMHRSPKQVRLTEAGEILYRRAKQILDLYEQARQDVQRLQHTVSGSLHLGASFTIGEYMLPRMLAAFAKSYPDVDIQVTIGNTEEIVHAIRNNQLDLGLIEGQAEFPDLLVTAYSKDEMLLVAPSGHPLAVHPSVKPELLQDQVWVMRENGSGTRDYSDRFIRELELSVRRSYVFNSSQGIKEAVAAGLGLAILSRWIVRKEIESGEIRQIIVQGRRMEREFRIIQNQDHTPTLACTVFREKLFDLA